MKKLLLTFSFCFFLLNSFSQIANQPSDLTLCDSNNDGFEEFDLTIVEAEVLGAQDPSNYTISYYETLVDADSGTNNILSPSNYTNISNPQTIYVRVEEVSTGNYDTTSFSLIAEQAPSANTPTPLYYCDPYNSGYGEFDLSSKDDEITGGNPDYTVTYYETLADAYNNIDAIDTSSLYGNIVESFQTLYVRVESNSNNCSTVVELDLVVSPEVQANPSMSAIIYELCDDNMETDEDPSNDSVQFDLSVLDTSVIGGQDASNLMVSYFTTQMDAEIDVNPLTILYQNIINPQVIYARLEDNISGCYGVTQATLIVQPLPYLSIEDEVFCQGESVTIDTELDSNNYYFSWYFENVLISGETTPSLIVNQDGTYQVEVGDSQSGCVTIYSFVVNEVDCTDSDSDGVIDADEDINENGNLDDDDTDGDNIPNYLDSDDDGDNVDTVDEIVEVSGRNNTGFHQFVDTDNDTIENYLDSDDDGDGVLTIDEDYNNNGNPMDDDTNANMIPDYLEAAVALGINYYDKLTFTIYPNPANSTVTISHYLNSSDDVKVNVYDVQGKRIALKLNTFNNSIDLDVTSLQSGMYFVEIEKGNVSQIQKLLIE